MYRRDLLIDRHELFQTAAEEGQKTTFKLGRLLEIQKFLEDLKNLHDYEPQKR